MKRTMIAAAACAVVAGFVLLGGALARGAETASAKKPAPNAAALWTKQKLELTQNISEVNRLASQPALLETVLTSIAKHSGNSLDSLEQAKKKTAMSYGDLVVAFALAKSANLKFDQVKSERRVRSWADLAALHKVQVTDLIDSLKKVQGDVEKVVAAWDKEEEQRRVAEERRMMRRMGIPPPPREQTHSPE